MTAAMGLTLVADQGVERQVVDQLRYAGFVVTYVAEILPSLTDYAVLALALEQGSLLHIGDKDFGELVFRRGDDYAGVVLMRLAGLANVAKADIVAAAFLEHSAEFVNAFTVISSTRIRIRRRNETQRRSGSPPSEGRPPR